MYRVTWERLDGKRCAAVGEFVGLRWRRCALYLRLLWGDSYLEVPWLQVRGSKEMTI